MAGKSMEGGTISVPEGWYYLYTVSEEVLYLYTAPEEVLYLYTAQ